MADLREGGMASQFVGFEKNGFDNMNYGESQTACKVNSDIFPLPLPHFPLEVKASSRRCQQRQSRRLHQAHQLTEVVQTLNEIWGGQAIPPGAEAR